MYIDEAGTTYANHSAIRKAFKHVSFPQALTDEVLAAFGVVPLPEDPDPETAPGEVVEEELVFLGGKWRKVKTKRQATPVELDAKTKAEAARVNKAIADEIEATNWTQLMDTPNSTQKAYATYRSLLRAIPAQVGFPFTIAWPTKP